MNCVGHHIISKNIENKACKSIRRVATEEYISEPFEFNYNVKYIQFHKKEKALETLDT